MENFERQDLIRKNVNYRLLYMNEVELHNELKNWNRENIISWLCWNDPNGIYKDEESSSEIGSILSIEEGRKIIMKQVLED